MEELQLLESKSTRIESELVKKKAESVEANKELNKVAKDYQEAIYVKNALEICFNSAMEKTEIVTTSIVRLMFLRDFWQRIASFICGSLEQPETEMEKEKENKGPCPGCLGESSSCLNLLITRSFDGKITMNADSNIVCLLLKTKPLQGGELVDFGICLHCFNEIQVPARD